MNGRIQRNEAGGSSAIFYEFLQPFLLMDRVDDKKPESPCVRNIREDIDEILV